MSWCYTLSGLGTFAAPKFQLRVPSVGLCNTYFWATFTCAYAARLRNDYAAVAGVTVKVFVYCLIDSIYLLACTGLALIFTQRFFYIDFT